MELPGLYVYLTLIRLKAPMYLGDLSLKKESVLVQREMEKWGFAVSYSKQ